MESNQQAEIIEIQQSSLGIKTLRQIPSYRSDKEDLLNYENLPTWAIL